MQPAISLEKEPPVWGQFAVMALLFLGAGFGGATLAERLSADSFIAAAAGMFAPALTFAIGLQWWLGTALVLAVVHRLRGRRFTREPGRTLIPGGAWVFVPIGFAFNGAAGLVVALTGSTIGWLATIVLYPLLGALHGAACWLAARRGYLPLPN